MAKGFLCDNPNCKFATDTEELSGWIRVQFPTTDESAFLDVSESSHFCSVKCLVRFTKSQTE